jgi:hypothetical protein
MDQLEILVILDRAVVLVPLALKVYQVRLQIPVQLVILD